MLSCSSNHIKILMHHYLKKMAEKISLADNGRYQVYFSDNLFTRPKKWKNALKSKLTKKHIGLFCHNHDFKLDNSRTFMPVMDSPCLPNESTRMPNSCKHLVVMLLFLIYDPRPYPQSRTTLSTPLMLFSSYSPRTITMTTAMLGTISIPSVITPL